MIVKSRERAAVSISSRYSSTSSLRSVLPPVKALILMNVLILVAERDNVAWVSETEDWFAGALQGKGVGANETKKKKNEGKTLWTACGTDQVTPSVHNRFALTGKKVVLQIGETEMANTVPNVRQ